MLQTEIQIPLDVVLEISASMDLQHSLRLLATCKDYQLLSFSKAFWFRALKRIADVHRRPLPCPGATDLSTMALDKLREMAIRAYTLIQNWSAENPTPVSVRTVQFQMSYNARKLHLIPGTHLILVLSLGYDIVCWDTIAGTCLGTITSPSPTYIGSNPFELPGQCFFGVAYTFGRHIELAVICVDYSDSANVTIAKIHSYEWGFLDSSHRCFDVALDGNQIGMILPISPLFVARRSILYRKSSKHAGGRNIAGSSSSQATQSRSPSIRRVAQAVHSHPPRWPYQLRPPRYNVFGVTRDSMGNANPDSNNCVHFWPAIDTSAELTLGPTCSYQHNHRISSMHLGEILGQVIIEETQAADNHYPLGTNGVQKRSLSELKVINEWRKREEVRYRSFSYPLRYP
ncbi:hypothetical protein C8J57DRAFT_1459359 [Mycena rebaudengoi]|nr:hypothetical protein C8J57DRAFT_1459359 [Mycena rebaudengoi]